MKRAFDAVGRKAMGHAVPLEEMEECFYLRAQYVYMGNAIMYVIIFYLSERM